MERIFHKLLQESKLVLKAYLLAFSVRYVLLRSSGILSPEANMSFTDSDTDRVSLSLDSKSSRVNCRKTWENSVFVSAPGQGCIMFSYGFVRITLLQWFLTPAPIPPLFFFLLDVNHILLNMFYYPQSFINNMPFDWNVSICTLLKKRFVCK